MFLEYEIGLNLYTNTNRSAYVYQVLTFHYLLHIDLRFCMVDLRLYRLLKIKIINGLCDKYRKLSMLTSSVITQDAD